MKNWHKSVTSLKENLFFWSSSNILNISVHQKVGFYYRFADDIWWETPAASLCEETFRFGYRILICFLNPVKILKKVRCISWFCAFLYILYKNCSSACRNRKSAIFFQKIRNFFKILINSIPTTRWQQNCTTRKSTT